jgi:hypothetical protein
MKTGAYGSVWAGAAVAAVVPRTGAAPYANDATRGAFHRAAAAVACTRGLAVCAAGAASERNSATLATRKNSGVVGPHQNGFIVASPG